MDHTLTLGSLKKHSKCLSEIIKAISWEQLTQNLPCGPGSISKTAGKETGWTPQDTTVGVTASTTLSRSPAPPGQPEGSFSGRKGSLRFIPVSDMEVMSSSKWGRGQILYQMSHPRSRVKSTADKRWAPEKPHAPWDLPTMSCPHDTQNSLQMDQPCCGKPLDIVPSKPQDPEGANTSEAPQALFHCLLWRRTILQCHSLQDSLQHSR